MDPKGPKGCTIIEVQDLRKEFPAVAEVSQFVETLAPLLADNIGTGSFLRGSSAGCASACQTGLGYFPTA